MDSIKVAKNLYVPVENIEFYVEYVSNFIKKKVRYLRKEDKVYDLSCGKRISSVIFLKSGYVILTPINIDTIHSRYMNAESGG